MKKTGIRTFGIIGGDKRQLFLAQSLSDCCINVILSGFDKLEGCSGLPLADIKTAAAECDAAIFPIPSVRADGTINTPFSEYKTMLDDEIAESLAGKPIFAAMRDKFIRACPKLDKENVYDYAAREEFAILNALPTAEGAVECAMKAYEGTISGSRTLVCGFGRIGKVLSKMLRSLDSDVTAASHSNENLAYIKALGYRSADLRRLKSARGFDIIFNTVPAIIFDSELLLNTDKNTIIIDLASIPGGVDFEAARRLGIDAVRALSLPGKCAPKAAGEIIKSAV